MLFRSPVRFNFCKAPEGIAFRINENVVTFEPLPAPPVDEKVRDREDMEQWLIQRLGDQQVPSKKVEEDGAQQGFPLNALRQTRRRLGIPSHREGFGSNGFWKWGYPEKSPDQPSAQPSMASKRQFVDRYGELLDETRRLNLLENGGQNWNYRRASAAPEPPKPPPDPRNKDADLDQQVIDMLTENGIFRHFKLPPDGKLDENKKWYGLVKRIPDPGPAGEDGAVVSG